MVVRAGVVDERKDMGPWSKMSRDGAAAYVHALDELHASAGKGSIRDLEGTLGFPNASNHHCRFKRAVIVVRRRYGQNVVTLSR
jgi:hypothetical protein